MAQRAPLARVRAEMAGRALLPRAAVVLAALAAPLSAAEGPARAILLVPDLGASTSDLRFPDIDDEEIVAFDPETGEILPFLQDSNWRSLLGDADGDGRFNDVPAQVDAIAAMGGSVSSAYDLLYSFTTDRTFLGGTVARDGDLVRLLPGGGAEIVVSEEDLRLALGTSSDIDLDAAAFEPDGTLLFSLDSSIVTSSAAIAAENGGSRVLPDETVFALPPAASRARVRLRDADVIAAVNRALGTSYASVIDVQGLEVLDGGEILFTTGIFSGPGAGAIFTTAGGGRIAVAGGIPLDGPAFQLGSPVDWNGLAIVAEPLRPLVLDTDLPVTSRSADGRISVRIAAGTPGGLARILATPVSRPVIAPTPESALRGTGYIFVARTDPMYARSLSSPRTLLRLDSRGDAAVSFRLRPTTPAITLTLQAVDETSRAASHGIVVEIVP